MLLHRIKAQYFKTYSSLDLDLSVEPEKPLILIGGANGGGKTTLFQAIYGALYGLSLESERDFYEHYNTGSRTRQTLTAQAIKHITLEIYFTGQLVDTDAMHIVTRRYELSSNTHHSSSKKHEVIEYVQATFGGLKYAYNTAMSLKERQKHQTEIAKIIKANLPEELSHYFLFDAMESGALMREDEIQRVIRENIENVMGFRKYIQLGRVAESLTKRSHAERLKQENEKHEYMRLLGEKRQLESRKTSIGEELAAALRFRAKNTEVYNTLKNDIEATITLTRTIEQTKKELETIHSKERAYKSAVEGFINKFEEYAVLPKIATVFQSEIALISSTKNGIEHQEHPSLKVQIIENIIHSALHYLQNTGNISSASQELEETLIEFILETNKNTAQVDRYEFLNNQEVRALEYIALRKDTGVFASLLEQKRALIQQQNRIPLLEEQLEEWRAHTQQNDYSLIRMFEKNEATIDFLESEQKRINTSLEELEQRLATFDIDTNDTTTPQHEVLQKLKPFFLETGEMLLQAKKRQIEMTMMQDLNINLVPYRGVIDRVEISDSLGDMTFKIFHTSGNEIALNQLNTASKQLVVQCLLKALHEYGEYNPPVMIDTVMGALDEASRQTVIEHYFPELSHQTILLSSDSEIRPTGDFDKLKPFISRAYTLQRDKEQQSTTINTGYFGKNL